MLIAMPSPIFSLDLSSPHRPVVPSPLSSSPLRPSQSSPPLSPCDPNSRQPRYSQSSPIKGLSSKFKYASRNVKPNPLRTSREQAQQGRRTLFLKNVRQRADDRKWEQRGGDQEALKLEWHILDRQRRQEKDTDVDGMVFYDDLEDIPEDTHDMRGGADDMMVDVIAREEEAELEAMLSLLDTNTTSDSPHNSRQPDSLSLSDDEDYDALFMDIMSREKDGLPEYVSSGQMDLS